MVVLVSVSVVLPCRCVRAVRVLYLAGRGAGEVVVVDAPLSLELGSENPCPSSSPAHPLPLVLVLEALWVPPLRSPSPVRSPLVNGSGSTSDTTGVVEDTTVSVRPDGDDRASTTSLLSFGSPPPLLLHYRPYGEGDEVGVVRPGWDPQPPPPNEG